MGGRVDVEGDLLTRGAIGGARLVSGAVVQLNVDKVLVGVDTLFHDAKPFVAGMPIPTGAREPGLIREGPEAGKRQ